MLQQINACADFLKAHCAEVPHIGIVLGSGLGNLSEQIEIEQEFPYSSIPNFPVSTVEGHNGRLIFGRLGDKNIVAMQGRFHYYEGYDMKTVTFPIRVMKALGVDYIFLSNAAGGVNPSFKVGDIMLINDHINLFPENPLRGKNEKELGTRFPAMNKAYNHQLLNSAKEIAKGLGIEIREGVYLGLTGPSYETPAEYRMFHRIGADAVGMSTVPEVIVAVHAGMHVFAVSIITNVWREGVDHEASHEEVLQAAAAAEPKLTAIIENIIKTIE